MQAPATEMRIALFTHSVNPRGGVVHTVELGEALQRLGHRVTIFLPAAPGERLYRPACCEIELLPVPAAAHDARAMAATRIAALEQVLPSRRLRQRFDVLHAQDSLSGNALATLQERGLIGPWWRTVHHLDDFEDPQLRLWQQRAVLSARHVLCVSDTWRDRLLQELGLSAWRVFNGVALERFQCGTPRSQALGPPRFAPRGGGRDPVLLMVGGVEERKNTARGVRALAVLRRSRSGARLLIAGGASLLPHVQAHRDHLDALRDTGLRDGPGEAVERLGVIAESDMADLYRHADAVLMPSLEEGFGLVALEALACATPVVVSHRPPFTEHLHGPGVHWCDPLDLHSIAHAADQALAQPMSAAAALCADFSWERSALRHELLYRTLAASLH